ncbi:MAG: response regulator [Planctomycetales bacterium]|nr:response regulator [Planctomycetales bacterium]
MQTENVGRPMEILLVEDSLVDARITIGALSKAQFKHRLTLTRDGCEATDFIERQGIFTRAPRPDLILLDLRLPKKDGLQVLTELKANSELSVTPVVVLTGSEDERDLEECQALGVDSYITKPVNLDKFLGVVTELRRYWQSDVILPGAIN